MDCLFCRKSEKNYKPGPHAEYICSVCVQMLLMADQEDLKRAYKKATELGFQGKMKALKSFMQGDNNGQQSNNRRKPRVIAKHFDRKRSDGPNRLNKKSTRNSKNRRALALSKGEPELPPLS